MSESRTINSPFQLWKEAKSYLAKSDETLWRDSFPIRGVLDPSRIRIHCLEAEFCFGGKNLAGFFLKIACDELDRRENPDDPEKEILFLNYAPRSTEDNEGWDEAESIRQHSLAKERWSKKNKS